MKFLKTKIGLITLILTVITIALSAWGLAQSRNAKKQIEQYDAQLQQQYSAQPQKSASDQNQAGTSTPISAPNASPTSAAPKSPANNSSAGTASQPATLSDADKQQAIYKINGIEGQLESYQAQYGYYPGDINASTFAGDGCTGGGCTTMFNPPSGVRFVYSPSPAGCATAAHNCQHFTLEAVDSAGNVIIQKTSLN